MLCCLRCVLVLRVVLLSVQAALAGSVDRDNDEKMDQQAPLLAFPSLLQHVDETSSIAEEARCG